MIYELVYSSPYTFYPVGTYTSVEDAERDCETRYKVNNITFARGEDGVYKASMYAEDEVILKLYERGEA